MSEECDEPFQLVEGEPAFLLDDGIAYVRGWASAQHAVAELRNALADFDHEHFMPYLRADVTVSGSGVVELGRVTPETALLIARALRAISSQRSKPEADIRHGAAC